MYVRIDSPLNGPQFGTVDVYDFTGAKVYEHMISDASTSFQIDLSGMAGGVYMIKVNSVVASYMRKVLIK